MNDNLPALPDTTSREVAATDTDSWVGVVAQVAKLAEHIAGTEFVPRQMRNSAPAVAAAILYGREAGLSPMTALSQTHVIEGKPALSSEAMRGLVLRAGHRIRTLEATGAIVRVQGRRAGEEEWGGEVVWTIDMARAAGLLGKKNWQNYPRQMLFARASAELCHRDFPDVIFGYRAAEELDAEDDLDRATAQPSAGTKVARGRKAPAKKALGAPAMPTERPPTIQGPPLPGEDGYAAHDQPAGGEGSSEGEASEPVPPAGVVSPESSGVEGEAGDAPEVAASGDASSPATAPRPPRPITKPQLRMVEASLSGLGVDQDRDERHLIAGAICGRAVTSMNDLSSGDASKLIDTLAMVPDKAALNELLDGLDAAHPDVTS